MSMHKSPMSRRTFVKLAAVTGAAATLGSAGAGTALAQDSEAAAAQSTGNVQRIRSSCRGCGKYECGTWVTVRDGKVVKIEGDTSYPGSLGNCCAKSQASVEACYHPNRLHYPLKRTNPKGEEPGWERTSWDDAYSTIMDNMNQIVDKYGYGSTIGTMGTSRVYAMNTVVISQIWKTINFVGPVEVCKGPRTALHRMTDGCELHFVENVITPKVFCQWGSGAEVANYDESGRIIVDNNHASVASINVDARMSNNAKDADYYLGVRPGTDGAVAMAWVKIIIDRELYDDLYVRRWTDATFLVAPDASKTTWTRDVKQVEMGVGGTQYVDTVLLTEDQVVAGGSPKRFMAYDELNDRLTYLDSETGLWEGETFQPQYVPGSEDYLKNASLTDKFNWKEAKGEYSSEKWQRPGQHGVFIPESSQFVNKLPALMGTYDVTLLDGTSVKAMPVLQYWYDNVAKQYTPERAEEISGVKASLIEEACMTYATRVEPESGYGNGGIIYAVTHEHTGNAINVQHSIQCIDVLLGNVDTPGGHRGPSFVPSNRPDQSFEFLGPNFACGGGNEPDPKALEIFGMLGAATFPLQGACDATTAYDAMRTGMPAVLKGGFSEAGGVLDQSNISEAWDAISCLDFYFNLNLWNDPISDLADVLLPVNHWLELSLPRTSQGSGGYMGALIKAVDAPGECRPDTDIVIDLYKVAGIPYWNPVQFPNAPDFWAEGDYMSEATLECTGWTWEEFKEKFATEGWMDCRIYNPNGFGSARRYETGWFRKTADFMPGFLTPTTRNEIWLTNLEAQMATVGQDGIEWALPHFVENKSNPVENSWHEEQIATGGASKGPLPLVNPNVEKYADYTVENYPYTLSTGRRIPVYFHSEHRQLPWCREVWPVPRLEVNPKDADDLGLAQGDWAWIETPFGKIRQCVDINASVGEGRMNAEHTWWFPELKKPGKGFDLCGCNCLVDSHAQCEAFGSPQLRGYLANVYKATPENSPFGDPCPCDDDGTEIIHSADDPRLKEWAPDYTLDR